MIVKMMMMMMMIISSVGTAMGHGLDGQGSIPIIVQTFFLLDTIQTGSRAHTASYPVGTAAGLFARG
jgi:hypothetical protein